jgi:hypothetical protein
MGTRSLTFVKNEDNEPIINMYRQYDGYPSGMGVDLLEFLDGLHMVNGIRVGEKKRIANGVHCLAAQLVSHFKADAGGIYLYPTTDTNCWQEYEYHIQLVENSKGKEVLHIKVYDNAESKWLFQGTIRRFKNWINKIRL